MSSVTDRNINKVEYSEATTVDIDSSGNLWLTDDDDAVIAVYAAGTWMCFECV